MKAILNKINEINSLIEEVNQLNEYPTTYNGGTWPYYVVIKPIKVTKQFVTIENDAPCFPFVGKKERYNMNKISVCGDEYCNKHLVYTLNVILKTFKKAIKNQ
jgi:glycyl-tRNA synthetase beta subunit